MALKEFKAEKLLYTMGEVTEMFDVKPSLIRFWERRFDILKPRKNRKGNRLFTPEDVRNLEIIYHLTKERGMTLTGVDKCLKSNLEEVGREAEIVRRLQAVRSLLVEIREELKEEQEGEVRVFTAGENDEARVGEWTEQEEVMPSRAVPDEMVSDMPYETVPNVPEDTPDRTPTGEAPEFGVRDREEFAREEEFPDEVAEDDSAPDFWEDEPYDLPEEEFGAPFSPQPPFAGRECGRDPFVGGGQTAPENPPPPVDTQQSLF